MFRAKLGRSVEATYRWRVWRGGRGGERTGTGDDVDVLVLLFLFYSSPQPESPWLQYWLTVRLKVMMIHAKSSLIQNLIMYGSGEVTWHVLMRCINNTWDKVKGINWSLFFAYQFLGCGDVKVEEVVGIPLSGTAHCLVSFRLTGCLSFARGSC